MNFDNLDAIILHLASPYNDRVYIGRDYTIQDLIDDLVGIGGETDITSDALVKAALEWREKDESRNL